MNYERQNKVVAKMINIDMSKTSFEELEMVEKPLYSSSALSLTTQAEELRMPSGLERCVIVYDTI